METRTEVKTYRIDKVCDVCGDGNMELSSMHGTLLTHPPKHPHKCNECGNIDTYTKIYPCIEYGEVDIDPEYEAFGNDGEEYTSKMYLDSLPELPRFDDTMIEVTLTNRQYDEFLNRRAYYNARGLTAISLSLIHI